MARVRAPVSAVDPAQAAGGAPGGHRLVLTVPATSTELAVTRRTLEAWLGAQAVPAGLVTDVLLVVDEAVANSVEHGYRDLPPGSVTVAAHLATAPTAALVISVSDHGRWREPTPEATLHRGRGVGIMRALAATVDIRVGAGTTVAMRFAIRTE
ncbi:ATP-binding protein [Actinokineospora sp. PR83]|uniref:ATP-binding protein n=1 Tax=Actinokineospora sp. PR83 TaxID=2884908 RepID=UPI0027DFFA51|nr:ATP-binding protein [Actinokineospora sp. PR83]MCG8917236.1 ATP-binding protein [Actinokineospora sp. PR83]